MNELPFLQALLTLLLAGKFLIAMKFLIYRVATWMGVGFFWRKGKTSGKRSFYWMAFVTWLASWLTLLFFSAKLWEHFHRR